MTPGTRLIVTTMRNEAPFILEWIAYHRLIGFTDFLVFTNDCEDGTCAILDRLAQLGGVTHLPNARRGKKTVQWQALRRAMNRPNLAAAEWVMVSDVDEFLVIHPGAGHLDDLFAAHPDARVFSVPWRMFGNSGQMGLSDQPLVTQFTRAAPEAMLWPWQAVQFKSLFRNGPDLARLGVHKPQLTHPQTAGPWIDGSGQPMRHPIQTVTLDDRPRYDLMQMNHYALGAMDSFLVKAARGRPNHSDDPIDLAYWVDRNLTDIEDRRILRHEAPLRAAIDDLMTDPVLADLHRQALAWRRQRIEQILATREGFYTLARLRQMPPSQVLSMDEQRAMMHAALRLPKP